MKKAFLSIIPVIILIIGCAGGTKPTADIPAANSGLLTLDQALKEAADRIDQRIPAKSKIAPLNFNSPHDKFSGYVLDELTACLIDTGKLTVVDRKEIDLIRSEIDYQYSGEVADESMQDVGRRLGAQSIISGSLTEMGGFSRIVIRVLNVQSASVEVQYRANIVNDAVMTALLTGGRSNRTASVPQRPAPASSAVTAPAAATQAAPATVTQTAPAAPSSPVFKIGDTGPAGGIIFYDKGSNSGGWRYLEAAPAETEFKSQFGEWNVMNVVTGVEVGNGIKNTQQISAALEEQGQLTRAASRVTRLNINGYFDWFIPSKTELAWMYINLKENRLGGFSNDWYWSSSANIRYGSSHNIWVQKFSDGTQEFFYYLGDKQTYTVRVVRQF